MARTLMALFMQTQCAFTANPIKTRNPVSRSLRVVRATDRTANSAMNLGLHPSPILNRQKQKLDHLLRLIQSVVKIVAKGMLPQAANSLANADIVVKLVTKNSCVGTKKLANRKLCYSTLMALLFMPICWRSLTTQCLYPIYSA